eukprot:Skav203751  [mRNA]  locus=scaffold68:564628:568163:+ [translate_table: standard]
MAGRVLGLCVPQWFGAGQLEQDAKDAVVRGAAMGFEVLQQELRELPRLGSRWFTGSGLGGFYLDLQAKGIMGEVFTIGGDCSVDLAPMSYLRQRYGPALMVAYIDAHADLNAEWETPSGHFHGMSLRAMLGTAPENLAPPVALETNRLMLLGARDLDPAEQKFIKDNEAGGARLPRAGFRELFQTSADEKADDATVDAQPFGI